jgi:hypothetical protein
MKNITEKNKRGDILLPVPGMTNYFRNQRRLSTRLWLNIRKNYKNLKEKLDIISGHWFYEDHLYRLYHHSFKVYYIQDLTEDIVALLRKLDPKKNKSLAPLFEELLKQGTGKRWTVGHNESWGKHTRPMAEAFLHAKYFLEMLVKYGKTYRKLPQSLPSGVAAILELYNLR